MKIYSLKIKNKNLQKIPSSFLKRPYNKSMDEKFIRVYQKLDYQSIKKKLLIVGDLSAICENCQKMDLSLQFPVCPDCKTEFKYVAFRSAKVPLNKLKKIMSERPSVKVIDFEDYKSAKGKSAIDALFKND